MNTASRPAILRLLGAIAALSLVSACSSAGGAVPSEEPLSPVTAPSPAAVVPSATDMPGATPRPSIPPKREPTVVAKGEAWIAYQGGTGEPPKIRLVRPDGSGDHALAPGILAGDQLHPD